MNRKVASERYTCLGGPHLGNGVPKRHIMVRNKGMVLVGLEWVEMQAKQMISIENGFQKNWPKAKHTYGINFQYSFTTVTTVSY